MPSIDQLVNAASSFQFLSFLNTYSGYNQFPIHPLDEEKMAFITPMANYCYKVMPFGLKNAGTTYQRLMKKVFIDYIRTLIEVYIDNMPVKTSEHGWLIFDLVTIFGCLCIHKMRLNPHKWAFTNDASKFLGFILTHREIKANLDKC